MYTLIEYPVGVIVEAVVLSMEGNRLRVAAAGFSDVLEFARVDLGWVAENGERVEIGYLQYSDREEAADFVPRALTLAAAVPCMA